MNAMIFFLHALQLNQSQKKRALKSLFAPGPTKIVAHRGLRSEHLENTLEALTCAFERGADGVEFDVQLSADMVPLVFHDRHLARLTGVDNTIDQLMAAEIVKLRQMSDAYAATYRIATLAEVLAVMPSDKLINIELKETTGMKGLKGMRAVLEVIEPHKKRLAIVISSFDPSILAMVHKLDSDYALGLLLDKKLTILSWANARSILNKVDYLHPHIDLMNQNLSSKIKKMGLGLILWGHKKLGQGDYLVRDQHTALISDACHELLKEKKSK